MIAQSLLVLATAALAAASPVTGRLRRRCDGSNSTVPTLPVNGDHEELPAPAAGLTLKRIALGYGIQNYTCASTTADAAATGALAGLFDITALYPGQGPDSLDQATFDRLTAMVIESADANIPLSLVDSLPDRVPSANPGADAAAPFLPAADLPIEDLGISLKHTGEHFFSAAGVPVFKLDGGLSIHCAKLDGFAAPNAAAPGNDNVGAVAWLRLGVKEGTEGAGTEGLKFVYRVQTGAGSSHGCKNGGASDSSFYTAAYWFYG